MNQLQLLLLFVFVSINAGAEIENGRWTNRKEALALGIPLEKIQPNPHDPYTPIAWMLKGEFRGRAIDETFRRPLLQLKNTSKVRRFANVDYKGEFWIAEVPRHGVEDVFMRQHDFETPGPYAHTELLYQFKRGSEIRLISQTKLHPRKIAMVPGLNISAEASGPPGVGFQGVADIQPRTVLVVRVSGVDERAPVQPVQVYAPPNDPHNPFIRYHLKIAPEYQVYRDGMFNYASQLSIAYGYDRYYYLIGENCTTTVYQIIDRALQSMPTYHTPYLTRPILNLFPRSTEDSLRVRGLYDD